MLRFIIDLVLVIAGLGTLALAVATFPDLHPLTLLALPVIGVALLLPPRTGDKARTDAFEATRR